MPPQAVDERLQQRDGTGCRQRCYICSWHLFRRIFAFCQEVYPPYTAMGCKTPSTLLK
jgi:hypothetical protein